MNKVDLIIKRENIINFLKDLTSIHSLYYEETAILEYVDSG